MHSGQETENPYKSHLIAAVVRLFVYANEKLYVSLLQSVQLFCNLILLQVQVISGIFLERKNYCKNFTF